MESISRTVNGRECTVSLTDSLVETLADLQGEGIDRNSLIQSRVSLLNEVISRFAADYEPSEAAEVLKLISGLSMLSKAIESAYLLRKTPTKNSTTMNDQEQDKIIEQTVAVLSETFTPASSLDESAKRYTSAQLAQAIYELAGVSPKFETLYRIMLEAGYRYVVDETSAALKYVWLLQYRG